MSGAELAKLEDAWALLLRTDDPALFGQGARTRGPALFGLAARLLRVTIDADTQDAAHAFGAVDLARHRIAPMPEHGGGPPARRARATRPLTAFGALAARDLRKGGPPFEPEATPGRAWTLLRHRFTGR